MTCYSQTVFALVAVVTWCGISAAQGTSQSAPSGAPPPEPATQTVVVTGAWEPIPLGEADRSVDVYPLRNRVLLFGTLADVLQLDSSVQVQSRAPGGVQGDVSIRGGTFEQTLFLINGIRLSDAQSAHHNFDLPVPLDAIDRIEVLRGSGSTLYGSDAVGGVINVLTTPKSVSDGVEVRVRGGYGNFSTNESSGFAAFTSSVLSQRFSFERELSTGFRDDREYRNFSLASESWVKTKPGLTRVFLALLDRPFGADQFYGPYTSWERTKTWLATLSQDLGPNTLLTIGYRRHTDLFELERDDPGFYTNRHVDDTWDVALRRQNALGKSAHLYYGAEGIFDHVDSNNLGVHSRRRGAAYGDFDTRSLRSFSFSAGAREEFYGRAQSIFIPNVSAGYWLKSKFRLRASVTRAFRLPNYTDLYYHDPANIGNPNLKPERAMNYEGGVDWHPASRVRGSFVVFSRHETDDIDYVRANSNAVWQATNFDRLTFTGWEGTLSISLPKHQTLEIEYTGLHGVQTPSGDQSKYVFNYPTEASVVAWQMLSPRGWLTRIRVGTTNQVDRSPYTLVDVYAAWNRSRVHPYLRLTNLANADYQPFYGVPMPGRAALVGAEICVFCPKH